MLPSKERDGRRHRREREGGGCILSPDLSRARSSSKLRIRWDTCPDISLKGVGIAIYSMVQKILACLNFLLFSRPLT